ncbi:MAG: ABC transporter ATP-binding protein [Acidobacteriota bacterium]
MPAPAVETVELTRRFGSFTAVDRVSLTVQQGEIFGFLGSNGAGKSTTIRMLCGLLQPTSGQARVGGFDVYREPEKIKQSIGYMSQRFSLYDELSVEENLDFFAGVYSVPVRRREARKNELLEEMGLREMRRRSTSVLPGGLKQRLALACAVLHEPPILFLDEPTSGVDPVARREFWDLIYRLAEAGRTVFVTTHYMDEAEYCGRLALMDAGRVIALDTPDGLRRSLAGEHFIQLEVSDVLQAVRAAADLPGVRDVAIFGGGIRLRVADPEQASRELPLLLASRGISVLAIGRVEPGIEDVFVLKVETERRREGS